MSNIKLFLEPNFSKSKHKVNFNSLVFFIGSCFSENLSNLMNQRKFCVLSNPAGILFDLLSIERCVQDIASKTVYNASHLFLLKGLYGSWNHHSSFSSNDSRETLSQINENYRKAHDFLLQAPFVVITLGSAFSYYHTENECWVANCHKMPQTSFEKKLLSIDNLSESLASIYRLLLSIHPEIKIILTISPVRHLRDGVIENNRSKARLIEAVHQFIENQPEAYYFPSYEIIIDVLRDYRFFDRDMAHPNYLATEVVFDYFKQLCIEPKSYDDMDAFFQLNLAVQHRPKHSKTIEHKAFLTTYFEKTQFFQKKYPSLDFSKELHHFETQLDQCDF